MNNDKVKVALCAKCKKKSLEGQVIEILERANTTFVGTLKVSKNYAFLLTETSTLANDIFIPKDKLKGGKDGDKAVVKITEWPEEAKNPFGAVHSGRIRITVYLPAERRSSRRKDSG